MGCGCAVVYTQEDLSDGLVTLLPARPLEDFDRLPMIGQPWTRDRVTLAIQQVAQALHFVRRPREAMH